jgi:hypothetical protein
MRLIKVAWLYSNLHKQTVHVTINPKHIAISYFSRHHPRRDFHTTYLLLVNPTRLNLGRAADDVISHLHDSLLAFPIDYSECICYKNILTLGAESG